MPGVHVQKLVAVLYIQSMPAFIKCLKVAILSLRISMVCLDLTVLDI